MSKVFVGAGWCPLFFLVLLRAPAIEGAEILIEVGDTWKFFRGRTAPSDPISLWRQPDFNDDAWEVGQTGIGYGDGDDQTVLSDMMNSYLAIFTRKAFEVPDPNALGSLFLSIDYDDGFVAHLNGIEVARRNMGNPGEEFALNVGTPGLREAGTPEVIELTVNLGLLVPGTNVLAVEVRNRQLDSSDLSFIPRLTANDETLLCPSNLACASAASGMEVNLTWENNAALYDSIVITRNGEEIPSFPGPTNATSASDTNPGNYDALYELLATIDGIPCTPLTCTSTIESRGMGTLQCSLARGDQSTEALLTWTNPPGAVRAEIWREGILHATLSGGEEEYVDTDVESQGPKDDIEYEVRIFDDLDRRATMTCGGPLSLCPTLACAFVPSGGEGRIRLSFGNLVKEWTRFVIRRSTDGGAQIQLTGTHPGDATEFVDEDLTPAPGAEYTYVLQPTAPTGMQVNCNQTCTINVPIPELAGYDPPQGGWDYAIDFEDHPGTPMLQYNQAKGEAGNLDGQWIRAIDRDQWDGSAPGEVGSPPGGSAPGGIEVVLRPGLGPCGEDIQVLRIVDPGDPSNPAGSLAGVYPNPFDDPSNKSIFLGFDTGVYDRNLLRSGVTFSARWRVDPDAPSYMNPSSTGDGEPLVGGALGNVGFLFRNENPALASEGPTASVTFNFNTGGQLQFSADNAAGGPFVLPNTPITTYHSLWVTVEDPDRNNTYNITVYANGQTTPFSFATRTGLALEDETFDFGSDFGNYLAIGLPHISNDGAIEIDYIAFKEGVHPPAATSCQPGGEKDFIRGDVDLNGLYELTDAIIILGFLFQAADTPPCLDSLDTDDNGELDLTDVIRLLGFMFQPAPDPLPMPGKSCGPDPTKEDPLDCAQSGCD